MNEYIFFTDARFHKSIVYCNDGTLDGDQVAHILKFDNVSSKFIATTCVMIIDTTKKVLTQKLRMNLKEADHIFKYCEVFVGTIDQT